MTLYYQIIKNSNPNNGKQWFTVRRAWMLFGFLISPPICDRWVGGNDNTSIYHSDFWAKYYDSLEDAQKAAEDNAAAIISEKRRKNITKTVVKTVVIKE